MSDDPKPAAEAAPVGDPAPAGAPPGTMPIPKELSESPTHRDSKRRDPIDEPSRTVDWTSLAPTTLGEILSDVIKVVVLATVIMNAWAVAHGCSVTTKIAIAGSFAGLLATLGWKSFLAVAEAYGTRVVGGAYLAIGVACCAVVLWYASVGETATTSKQLKTVIHALGLAFLYPAGLGLFALLKGDDVSAINPLGFPMSPRWFQTLWVLFAKEVRTFFTTGVPYIIMVAFAGLNGLLFHLLVKYYSQPGTGDLTKPGEILASNGFTMLGLWLIWPGITMRLVAEEKRLGTIETLLTVPVTDAQVIFSKYAAAMAFYAVNLVPFLGYHVVMALHARDWDWGPVFAEFLGLFLWGGLAMAIGLFYSTLTDSQLVAYILGAFTNVTLYFVSAVEGFVKEETVLLGFINLKAVSHYISVHGHYQEFVKGVVSTSSLAFFLTGIGLALFASIRGLEAQRWK